MLEIDLQGAEQVRRLRPDAVLVLLLPPSADVQAERLRARGDDETHIAERLAAGEHERRRGEAIADAVVVEPRARQATATWPVYWSVSGPVAEAAAPPDAPEGS